MLDGDGDGINDDDSSVITATKAKEKIKTELLAANKNWRVTDGQVEVTDGADDAAGKTTYTITKGYATVADNFHSIYMLVQMQT